MYVYNDYINAYNFAQKFQAVREKNAKIVGATFCAAPCSYVSKIIFTRCLEPKSDCEDALQSA